MSSSAGVTAEVALDCDPVADRVGGGDLERVAGAVGQPGDRGARRGRGTRPTIVVCGVPEMYGVTVYSVIGLPPLLVGALQLTVARPRSRAQPTRPSAPSGREELGVTALDGSDRTGPR